MYDIHLKELGSQSNFGKRNTILNQKIEPEVM